MKDGILFVAVKYDDGSVSNTCSPELIKLISDAIEKDVHDLGGCWCEGTECTYKNRISESLADVRS